MFTKCLFRLVVDLSKAGRPAPQKKPRTKAKPFQIAMVSNPIRARQSYFQVASARPERFGTLCKFEWFFAFARPSFVVLAALRSTDRRRIEKDIFSATRPNANVNYLKASWPKTSKANRELFVNRRFAFEVFGHEALI